MIKVLILIALHTLSCAFDNQNKEKNVAGTEGEIKTIDVQENRGIDTNTSKNNIIEQDESDNDEKIINNSKTIIKTEITDKPNTKLPEKAERPKLKEEKEPGSEKSINADSDVQPNTDTVGEDTIELEGKSSPPINQEEKVIKEDPDAEIEHSQFDGLLKRHVRNGKVDYVGLKRDIDILDGYLENLKNNRPKESDSKNEKLAFWINAYNAFTIKLILENYPLKSIIDLHGGKPWDVKWIEIGNKKMSLNNIENDIIRPKFNEPRIHFAVNCAAKSCPPLASTAFTANNLNSLLEERTTKFINDPNFNSISKSKIVISKIFDWYGQDFEGLITFIGKYSTENISNNAQVSYKEYDWSLNN